MAGLNDPQGIVPHAHQLGWDTKDQVDREIKPKWLQERVKIHCCQETYYPTPFSSWSHDWRTALGFCLAYSRLNRDGRNFDSRTSHIAVLDTWALGDRNMLRNKIFHVNQFGIPRVHCLCEWLIWGPVSGPAYRCVSLTDIRKATNCRIWPNHNSMRNPTPYLTGAEIRKSILVAGCFQTKGDDSADVMLAVAAAELARNFWGNYEWVHADGEPESIFGAEPLWPRHMLKQVLDLFSAFEPVLSGRPLVHGHTAIEGFPRRLVGMSLKVVCENLQGLYGVPLA
ncbi:hypothetical protein KVR01_006671 [Diaporthe batatas]|uniref:uncharacterized protein n=1 Tax=Diaporthe batatas TaxID=748121 RepID=UPI001D047713|nr:uncharacterized protein KVR01_006671 [Diaporthe batatas]KAG8163374.1 hypothetical protein KVR01_006671 [Diaporthe batatas]